MLLAVGMLLLLPTGLIRRGHLTRVKSHALTARPSENPRSRAIKLLDAAESDRMAYVESARRTGLSVSTLRSWTTRGDRYSEWTPTNTLWGNLSESLYPAGDDGLIATPSSESFRHPESLREATFPPAREQESGGDGRQERRRQRSRRNVGESAGHNH
jgi:hypothetical protein